MFVPACIRPSEGVLEAPGRTGQLALSLLAVCSSGLVGKASLVEFSTEGSGEALKRGYEFYGDEDGFIVRGSSMFAKGNQEG